MSIIKPEYHAPITGHPHSIVSREIAGQRMKPHSQESYVLRTACLIKRVQNQSESPDMPRIHTSHAATFIQFPQPPVPDSPDHAIGWHRSDGPQAPAALAPAGQ